MSHPLTLSGSSESLPVWLADYTAAWKAFMVVHHLDILDSILKQTTISWKVSSRTDFLDNIAILTDLAGQIHIGTVNGRHIATAILHQAYDDLPIIKVMERREGSNDRLGLDSIDYLTDDLNATYQILIEAGAHVVREHNAVHRWLSLRFGQNLQYEAKITDHLLIDVAIKELEQAKSRVLKQI